MYTKRLTYIPIDLLWEYREFKRDEVKAPRVPFINSHNLDEVCVYIKQNGITEPLELSIVGEKALLTDGNHRIAAAKRLGYKDIPVYVMVFFSSGDKTFYKHTLDRFKPVNGDLELWLKKLFL
jgi:hypothetical protein